jgi:predicted alpha/beta-hydrolase family hydrolase
MLFVQGGRDPFGTSDEIRALLPALHDGTLHEVAGGDHSLNVPALERRGAAVADAIAAAAAWVRERAV